MPKSERPPHHLSRDAAPVSDASLANHVRHGRVLKTLWPPAPGTVRHRAQFGAELLCVRYRQDPRGLRRFVTVELIVDTRPARPARTMRALLDWWFALDLRDDETGLQRQLRAHGGRWSQSDRCWYLRGEQVFALALEDRVAAPRR